MGQGLSCWGTEERELFGDVQRWDLEFLQQVLKKDSSSSSLIHSFTTYRSNSVLHIAAASGYHEIVSLLMGSSLKPDVLNRHNQTPLMLAAMYGKISCVKKLTEAGANILVFDSSNARICLHYSAYYGHVDCLETILVAARTSNISASWGFSRFVNIRDKKGATPLHLAARRHSRCVRMLLNHGALVSASTNGYNFPGSSTPLHSAARGGSIDCIRELLAWGADRLQRDASGRIPYVVALRHNHGACAALLNPSSLEPLVWPSPMKFISELNEDAKALLEQALIDANREREKIILKGNVYSNLSPLASDSEINSDDISEETEADLCMICFNQACTIEVRDCGHMMCAQCLLALCCHNKPSPASVSPPKLVCPFCRSSISKLSVANVKDENEPDHDVDSSKPQKTWRSSDQTEECSSFKSLSFSKTGRGSGRIAANNEIPDKPSCLSPVT